METWKDIITHEGLYQVSNLGAVKSLERKVFVQSAKAAAGYHISVPEKLLKKMEYRTERGGFYEKVSLWNMAVCRQVAVHILVCEAFHGERPAGHVACHRDGDGLNNADHNLYWGTPKQNSEDTKRHGRVPMGEDIPWAKLSPSDVSTIRSLAGKIPQTALASRFKVSQSQISRVVNLHEWRHV